MYLLCMQTICFGDIETPEQFSLTRSLCFAPLWNNTAEILQYNAEALGFRSLHIIGEASAFRKVIYVIYIQILVKIIDIFFSDV